MVELQSMKYICGLFYKVAYNHTGNVRITQHGGAFCNHCCSGKTISITCCECVFAALGIQHAMRMRILSTAACSALQYFSTLSHKHHNFRKKKIISYWTQKCVLWFPLQRLSEAFLIVRRNMRDIIKNVYWSYSCPIWMKLEFSLQVFRKKILKYQISWKSAQCESSCSMRTDRGTDIKLTVAFRTLRTRLKTTLSRSYGSDVLWNIKSPCLNHVDACC